MHDQTLSCLEIKFDVDEMDNPEENNLPLDSKISKKETKQYTLNLCSTELPPRYPKSSAGTTVKDEETDMKGKDDLFGKFIIFYT